jgi:Uncharacterized protein conserved in bacteria
MKLLLPIFLTALLSSAGLAGDATTARIKALLVTGGHGFEAEPFFAIFQDNPEIEFTAAKHARDADVYERADLFEYRVAVLYDMPKTITDAQKARFLALFDQGIGVVVLHHALVSYPDWPEYAQIIGGHYSQQDEKTGLAGYQHDVDIPVQIVAKTHPITAGLGDFLIHDEIYWGFRVQPDATPLLTTTHPRSGNPLAWCRTQGASRVVYLQLGHGPTAFENPNYRKLVAACIRWAARTETLK